MFHVSINDIKQITIGLSIVIISFPVLVFLMLLSNQRVLLYEKHLGPNFYTMICRYDDIRRLIIFNKRRLGTDIRAIMIICNDGQTHELMVKEVNECYEDIKNRCKNLDETTITEFRENDINTKIGDITFEIIGIIKTSMMNDFRKMLLVEFTEGNLTMLFSKYCSIQDKSLPDFWKHDRVKKSIKNRKYNSSIGRLEFWCPEDYLEDYDFFFALSDGRIEEAYKIYEEIKKRRMQKGTKQINKNSINFISMKKWMDKYSQD
jgi:cellobiose-specific phosphotransferase system component IIB